MSEHYRAITISASQNFRLNPTATIPIFYRGMTVWFYSGENNSETCFKQECIFFEILEPVFL